VKTREERRCHSLAVVQESSVKVREEKRCHSIAVVQAAPDALGRPRWCTGFVRTGRCRVKEVRFGRSVSRSHGTMVMIRVPGGRSYRARAIELQKPARIRVALCVKI
jgi:hypothetical protein